MLLTEEVEVGLGVKTLKYYEELGYEIPRYKNKYGVLKVLYRTKILVKVKDLTKGSHVKVKVLCDRCEIVIMNKPYKEYLINNKNSGLDTCNECRQKFLPDLILKKYGVRSTFQIEEVKEKSKKTRLEKYGVEYPSQSKEIREKQIQTNLERYEFEYSFQSPEIKEKIKNTNIKRYGVGNPSQLFIIKEKVKQTNLKRFGKEHYRQTKEYKDKFEATCMKKYKVKHYMQTEYYRKKYSGENSYLWKGGITLENQKIRNSLEYKEWRQAVFDRDDYTCQVCGKRGGKLHAHHIENFADNKELRFNIDNGATVCLEHHSFIIKGSFHNIYGNCHNNKSQFQEYINNYKEFNDQLQEEVT